MSLARPAAHMLKNQQLNDLKKHVIIATGISVVVAAIYKISVGDWRKAQYQNFFKTYNEEAHFKRMVNAGVFQSVKPDTEAPQWVVDYESEVDRAIANLKN